MEVDHQRINPRTTGGDLFGAIVTGPLSPGDIVL
jgi:hypothetical protein